MTKPTTKKIIGIVFLLIVITALYFGRDVLNLETIQGQLDNIIQFTEDMPVVAGLLYILAYALIVIVALPGAAIMTLLGGAIYGWSGVPLTVIGATVGALGSFWLSRYLVGDWVKNKYGKQLENVNNELEKNGTMYFFSIRVSPVFPFFLVNLVAGLTPLTSFQYLWTTVLGIIPGTAAYTYAGFSLSQIDSVSDAISFEVASALGGLALVSWLTTIFTRWYQSRSAKKTQSA